MKPPSMRIEAQRRQAESCIAYTLSLQCSSSLGIRGTYRCPGISSRPGSMASYLWTPRACAGARAVGKRDV
jgi:hypothetical protein